MVAGGATVAGGIVVTDTGLEVQSGGANISGGANVTGGITVTDTGLTVNAGGVSIDGGELGVSSESSLGSDFESRPNDGGSCSSASWMRRST